MKRITDFATYRREGRRICVATCYDAASAQLVRETAVDALLVGDSLAMVVHGFPSTVHADVPMMALHTAAVARGAPKQPIVADLPFLSYRQGLAPAMLAADALMKAGAHAVKLEGVRGHEDIVRHLVESGVPVMGHLGLTPQHVNQIGGYKVQGREPAVAQALREDALRLQELGCFSVVLELVPAALAAEVTASLQIPTIGIGSGPECSGQVLVWHDLLGLNDGFKPRFLRHFAHGAADTKAALNAYAAAVHEGSYPSAEESFA
ncbi:MAG: 3-methyl-2-oxobutanoate hydroxymethyltransferase [Verrucomicrobiota bacterium JB022]|nr:3-methyl-2-oxobutanoate hydroxymethyltransferase [Verrucomicrobiota bacterium JB022]